MPAEAAGEEETTEWSPFALPQAWAHWSLDIQGEDVGSVFRNFHHLLTCANRHQPFGHLNGGLEPCRALEAVPQVMFSGPRLNFIREQRPACRCMPSPLTTGSGPKLSGQAGPWAMWIQFID